MLRWLFQRHIVLPNPLWWLGAVIVYPSRWIKRRWFTKPSPPNLCEACGAEIGNSLWGWCSPECLFKLGGTNEPNLP